MDSFVRAKPCDSRSVASCPTMTNGVFSVANIEKAMGSDPVSADNDHWCLLQPHPLRPLRNSGPQSAALDLLLVMTRRCVQFTSAADRKLL